MKNKIWVFVVAFISIGLINIGQLSAQGITATANNLETLFFILVFLLINVK